MVLLIELVRASHCNQKSSWLAAGDVMTNEMMDYSLLLIGEAGEGVDGWVGVCLLCCCLDRSVSYKWCGDGVKRDSRGGVGAMLPK